MSMSARSSERIWPGALHRRWRCGRAVRGAIDYEFPACAEESRARMLDVVRSMPQTIVYGGEDVEPGRGRLYASFESADIPAIEALRATVTAASRAVGSPAVTPQPLGGLSDAWA
jgi:hypothetical protein